MALPALVRHGAEDEGAIMKSDKVNSVSSEALMERVEALILSDYLSEEEKIRLLKDLAVIVEEDRRQREV